MGWSVSVDEGHPVAGAAKMLGGPAAEDAGANDGDVVACHDAECSSAARSGKGTSGAAKLSGSDLDCAPPPVDLIFRTPYGR